MLSECATPNPWLGRWTVSCFDNSGCGSIGHLMLPGLKTRPTVHAPCTPRSRTSWMSYMHKCRSHKVRKMWGHWVSINLRNKLLLVHIVIEHCISETGNLTKHMMNGSLDVRVLFYINHAPNSSQVRHYYKIRTVSLHDICARQDDSRRVVYNVNQCWVTSSWPRKRYPNMSEEA